VSNSGGGAVASAITNGERGVSVAPTLVGRERQVRELRLVLDAVLAGRGNLVVLAGEAGIGKTRLAQEAVALAQDAGVRTVWVTCPGAGAPPFWPWAEALRQLDAAMPAAGRGDPEVVRFRLFERVTAAFREATADAPVLVVLDDVQWADPPSVRLLAHLAPQLSGLGLLVVATLRDRDEAERVTEVLPDLVRHGRQLHVTGLRADALSEMVGELVDDAIPPSFLEALETRTGGNPLFVRELVRAVADDGAFDDTTSAPLPDSLRVIIGQRLRELSPETRAVLDTAAVLGVQVDPVLLTEVCGGDVVLAVDEATRARVLTETSDGAFAFVHPLVQEAVDADLGVARRVRLHQDVGEALERQRAGGVPVDTAEIAHHFSRAAAAGSAPKAAIYAEEAGREAMAMLAYEDAARRFDDALSALDLCEPDPRRRVTLLLARAEARVASGAADDARADARAAAKLAREGGWPDELARAALALGSGPSGFEIGLDDREQIQLLEEALEALGDEPTALRAWVLARLAVASWPAARTERRAESTTEAVAIARAAADPGALAYALAAHCDVIAGPEHSEQRIEESTEIIDLALRNGDVRMELLGRRLRLVALLEVGDTMGVDADISAYERAARLIRQPLFDWYVPLWRGMRALMEGRFTEVEQQVAEAERIGEAAHSSNAAVLAITLRIGLASQRGEPLDADEVYTVMVAGWPELEFMGRMLRPNLLADSGRLDEARAALAQVDLDDLTVELYGSEWLELMFQLGETVWRIGGHELGPRIYGALLPFADRFAIDGIGAVNFGCAELPLGLLAALDERHDDARTHLRAALRLHRMAGADLLVARVEREAMAALGEGWQDGGAAEPAPRAAQARAVDTTGSCRREGDVWTLTFDGRTTRFKQSKGLADLAQLLATPGREIHVLDLVAPGGVVAAGSAGDRLDDTARDAYKARLVELDAELDEADAHADLGRAERLVAEREALLAELRGAYGLGGRARRTGEPAERARSAVTQRLRDAMGRIEAADPGLGGHLRRSVRTGTYCVYEPDPPTVWEVDLTA
jgi:tetratricopeptide (TPR) repeat protein